MKSKILIVFLSLLVFFQPIQQQKAKAAAFAVPLGIEIGAGAYVTGALAIAGIAGVMGYSEYEEEINTHAKKVWSEANEVVKDSVKASIETAVSAGKSTIELGEEFVDWYKNTAIPYLSTAITFSQEYLDNIMISNGFSVRYYGDFARVMFGRNMTLYDPNGDAKASHPTDIYIYDTGYVSLNNYGFTLDWSPNVTSGSAYTLFTMAMTKIKSKYDYTYEFSDYFTPPIANLPIDNYAEEVARNTEKALNHSISEGVSIPVEDIKPMTLDGQALTYDPTINDYKLPDGSIYDPALDGAMDWTYPVPKVVTGESGEVVIDDVTGIAKTEVETGTGTIADSITGTFPITGTGEGVGTGEGTGEGTPTKKPDDVKNKFGALITNKFPFSLPWDVSHIVGALTADPERPKIDLHLNPSILGTSFNFDISHDFAWMDRFIPFVRVFVIISFMIFLVLSTRKLLGGGQ